MGTEKLLIIGGVAAGSKVAAKARREDSALDIEIITDENLISYAGCGLPYFIGDVIKEEEDLRVVNASSFEELRDIRVTLNTKAVALDPVKREITVFKKETGKEEKVKYGTLVIATGASPKIPPVSGIGSRNIFTLRTVEDSAAIKKLVKKGIGNAVVIGSGFIGVEVAENLVESGIKTTLVEMDKQVLPGYDYDVSLFIKDHMEEKGLSVLTESSVTEFKADADGKVTGAVINGKELPADLVVVATGVRPNVDFLSGSGIELGQTGAIKVDRNFKTNLIDVFAAGDCVETVNLLTGKPAWGPLGSTANKMGRILAANRFGNGKESLPGILGTMIVKVFDISAAKTGLTEKQALSEGYDIETVVVPGNDTAGYYPGFKEIITKLTVDRKTRRVLGGQIFGWGVVDKPIDILVTAITLKAGVEDLSQLDLAYAPPFSNAMASTISAANTLKNKLDGKLRGINPLEVYKMKDDPSLLLLDVRKDDEVEDWSIPGSLHIENIYIRKRINEISRKSRIVVICKRGVRAYNMARYLVSKGFSDVSILDGGTVFARPLWQQMEKR